MEDKYKADLSEDQSFLKQRSEAYFNGRQFLNHNCYLMITRKADGRRPVSSAFSNLLRPSLVPDVVLQPQLFHDFLDKASQFIRLLSEGNLIRCTT